MTAFLNIVLLILGVAATLAAFMGKTSSEGPEPFLRRINGRGWVSLVCLFLAFVVGAFKELRTHEEGVKKDSETKEAREELERQGLLNLLTALGNSEQRVADVQFFIPFTDKGTESQTIHGSLLPAFSVPACGEHTDVEVAVWLGKGGTQDTSYTAADLKDRHVYLDVSPSKADVLLHPDDAEDMEAGIKLSKLRISLGQDTSNLRAYGLDVHVLDQNESAVHFLYPNLPIGDFPISIRAHTPQASIYNEGSDSGPTKPNPDYSPTCDREVEQYFRGAFDKASVGITLSKNRDITIYFRLKVVEIRNSIGGWTVSFGVEPGVNSRPWVAPSDDFETLLNIDWRSKQTLKSAPH